MEIFDKVLNKEEKIHEEVTPEKEVNIVLKEPEAFKNIFFKEDEE